MKDLKLYSFFFLLFLVFYSFPACCLAGSFADYFFGSHDVSHPSFSHKLPQIGNTSGQKRKYNSDGYTDITLHVVVQFRNSYKVAYFPAFLQSFDMKHINTKTKLPKFKKRIREAFPTGMYGLEGNNLEDIDIVMNGVYMKPEDSIEVLIKKSGIGNVEPLPVTLIVHPNSKWTETFFFEEANHDYEKAKYEYDQERERIKKDVNKFLESLNMMHFRFYWSEQVCVKNINVFCSEAQKRFTNKHVQALIQTECNEWKHRLANAKNKLHSKQQYLDSTKKYNFRRN